MNLSWRILFVFLVAVCVLGGTQRRERDNPAQHSQTGGLDEEIDSLRDSLYSQKSRGLMADTEEILAWIRLASILQMKDTLQNTGGGILQGEAVDALTEALSIIDRMTGVGGSIGGATDQKQKELLSSKFHAHHVRGLLHRSMGNPTLAVVSEIDKYLSKKYPEVIVLLSDITGKVWKNLLLKPSEV